MNQVVNFDEMKLRRFSKEMKEIVDEVVKIERKWCLGIASVESAQEDLIRILDLIEKLMDKAERLNLFEGYDLVKFRLNNAKAKVKQALRGEWGE